MTSLPDILSRYEELCGFCEAFWKNVFRDYPRQFACGSGCSTCCELQSVNFLEAASIARYLSVQPRDCLSDAPAQSSVCPFLTGGKCTIYPARPLICRTHGLLLKSDEFAGGIAVSCPYNFTTVDSLDTVAPAAALDIDRVTTGLARLNVAFCMQLGDKRTASERIELGDLASGRIGPEWFER